MTSAAGATGASGPSSEPPGGNAVLRLDAVSKRFPAPGAARLPGRHGAAIHAVQNVSLELHAGETLAVVGESGCGKSTLARLAARLLDPSTGRVRFRSEDVTDRRSRGLRAFRRQVQVVFQDPYGSLNPRMTVRDIVAEPLRVHGLWRDGGSARVAAVLGQVGLREEHAARYPHELSGGQRQRAGIARALALEPSVLILDEPVSALDVSIQAQILNLLADLRDELGLAYLFIAHDLGLVRHVADRVAVMYLGTIVEQGPARDLTVAPTHPYTQALLSAVPVSDPALRGQRERIVPHGDVPSAVAPPSCCVFRTRCWKAQGRCAAEVPELVDRFGHGHPAACHYAARLGDVLPSRP